MHDLCPRCGTERIGAFRFCRYCRFDFDALGADPATPQTGRSPSRDGEVPVLAVTARRWAPARGLLVLMVAVATGVAGLSTDALSNLGSPSSAFSSPDATPPSERQVAEVPEATPRGTPAASANVGPGPNGTTTRAKVVRVIDGDTILVAFGGKRHEVRYLGLSTPAAVGRRATAANAALVAGKAVVLETDVSQTDRSGRLLRYVWVQHGSRWMLVNLELVQLGLATIAIHPPDAKYADRYAAAEAHARAGQLGVWARGSETKPPKAPKASKPPVSPLPSDRR